MHKRLSLGLAALGLAAACGDAPTTTRNPAAGGPIGALLITAELDTADITRVAYTITAPDLATPVVGEIGVVDRVAAAQLTVPAGEQRTLELSYRGTAGQLCSARARDLDIEAGRTAQLVLVPSCGDAHDDGRASNKPPRIEAVFATRRSVRLGDVVTVAVFATDTNNDVLSYRWSESIAGNGFDRATSAFTTWKAGPRSIAHNTLTVVVNDGKGSTVSQSMTMDFSGVVLTAGTCAAPTPIQLGAHVRGFTVGAGSVHGSEACQVPTGVAPEHVYRLDLTTTQDLSVSVAGSAFFTRVYVRRGDCAAGPELACDNFSQRVDIAQAEPGTYYIFVDGDSVFGQGEYQLSVFSGNQAEDCRNFTDDDNDGQFDCADSDCANSPGCFECAFECDPSPNDCLGGDCDRFNGRCNTFVRFGETCDRDQNPATADVCDNDGKCVANNAVCGNGLVELGEECDDGNLVDGDGCSATCRVVAVCGNGVIEPGEDCDDGNTAPGDGCDAGCRIEQCGPISCDDGNPCTADVCADPMTGTCTRTDVADGTVCDTDGSPATTETCQAGICLAPAPDKALIILDPTVLADPAFSLKAMHDRLSPTGDGAAQFAQWATTLTVATTINGQTAAARPGFAAFFAGLPRDGAGRIDVAAAGFLPSAMVNRFDLRQPGTCGENRLVFTKTSGATDPSDRGTLIFEFMVMDDGTGCRNALEPWLALRDLEGDALRAASVAILQRFATPARLNQFRTNEFVNAPIWELREFHLVGGALVPATVVDSVSPTLAQDLMFRQFVAQNAFMLNHGAREIGIIPSNFLAASSLADGSRLFLNGLVPTLPGLEANMNILSCSGCHLTETGTQFVHIVERPEDRPSQLSQFMRSELEFRFGDLERFIATEP